MTIKTFFFAFSTLISMSLQAKPVRIVLTSTNTVAMDEVFSDASVARVAAQARALDNPNTKDPIYLIINSPGGGIDAGIELIENLNALNRPVHTVTIFSASMGFQTAQGVKGTRYIQSNGTLMSHKARGGFQGEFPGQIDSRYSYYLKKLVRMDQITVNRTKGKHTLKSYRDLYENEYWCDGQDCIDQGFADQIAVIYCDDSLAGTYQSVGNENLMFGLTIQTKSTKAKCPTITGSLSSNVIVDGVEVFKDPLTQHAPLSSFGRTDTFNYQVLRNLAQTQVQLLEQEINRIARRLTHPAREVIKGY